MPNNRSKGGARTLPFLLEGSVKPGTDQTAGFDSKNQVWK